ncbi:unnamed protein product [Linum trigynum]|uniref:Uncharacterized protein n=1 Tax=Linum trigynum TaxID=586398 RepID=A0AAV2D5H9_9ROSI
MKGNSAEQLQSLDPFAKCSCRKFSTSCPQVSAVILRSLIAFPHRFHLQDTVEKASSDLALILSCVACRVPLLFVAGYCNWIAEWIFSWVPRFWGNGMKGNSAEQLQSLDPFAKCSCRKFSTSCPQVSAVILRSLITFPHRFHLQDTVEKASSDLALILR